MQRFVIEIRFFFRECKENILRLELCKFETFFFEEKKEILSINEDSMRILHFDCYYETL